MSEHPEVSIDQYRDFLSNVLNLNPSDVYRVTIRPHAIRVELYTRDKAGKLIVTDKPNALSTNVLYYPIVDRG